MPIVIITILKNPIVRTVVVEAAMAGVKQLAKLVEGKLAAAR